MSERIDILVSAQNRTGGAFNAVKQELQGLDQTAATLSRGLSGIGALAGAGAIVAGLQQIGAEMEELARRGAIFQQLSSVLDDFAASVGSSADAFVSAGKRASQGTISEYELILNANRAIQFEVAKTSGQYAKLIELSSALGRAQGISDTQALEFITTGIARESRLILDNLGLIINLEEATRVYAATIGKTADELTTAERKQALLNEAFRQGEVAIKANKAAAESPATRIERLDANIQNIKDQTGQAIAAIASNPIASISNDIQAFNEQVFEGGKSLETLNRELTNFLKLRDGLAEGEPIPQEIMRLSFQLEISPQEAAQIAVEETRKQILRATEAQGGYNDELNQAQDFFARGASVTEEYREALRRGEAQTQRTGAALQDLYAALENASPATRRLANEMLESGYSVAEVTDRVRILRGELNLLSSAGAGARSAIVRAAVGVAGIIGDEAALNLAKQKTGELNFALAALDQQVQDGTISSTELAYETARLNEEFTGSFDAITEADRAAKQFAKEGMSQAESAAKKAASEIEQAFEKLKGTVSGVLQEALDVGVGVDPNTLLKTGVILKDKEGKDRAPTPDELLLPRADAINEEARRLADIAVKGFESPWLEYFKTAWPDLYEEMFANAQDNDSVRKTAALLLRNFEDGLNPELIDKEKAKDRVKRILLGEKNMAALAQEIAAELSAEFGSSISLGKIQATANAALGVDGSTGVQLAQSLTGVATEASGQAAVIGSNIRTGIVSALDGVGEAVATTIDKQFRAENNLKVIVEAGKVNGEAWGSGFLTAMDTLTSQVLEKLAGLISPYVEATQARNATLNGAN